MAFSGISAWMDPSLPKAKSTPSLNTGSIDRRVRLIRFKKAHPFRGAG